jgi:hypothetical protein
VKSIKIQLKKKECEFHSVLHVFWNKIEDIFGFRGWILMKDLVLETLWVAFSMIKISSQNFTNFFANFGRVIFFCNLYGECKPWWKCGTRPITLRT